MGEEKNGVDRSEMPKKIEEIYIRRVSNGENSCEADGGLLSKLRDFADIRHGIRHEDTEDRIVLEDPIIDETSEANLLVIHGRLRVHKGKHYAQVNFVYPGVVDHLYVSDIRYMLKKSGFKVPPGTELTEL